MNWCGAHFWPWKMKAVCWASGFNKPPAAMQCCLAQKKNNISINNSNNLNSGGTAQLVECLTEKPDAILTQVQVQSAARDCSPRVGFFTADSLLLCVQPPCATASVKTVWTRTHTSHAARNGQCRTCGCYSLTQLRRPDFLARDSWSIKKKKKKKRKKPYLHNAEKGYLLCHLQHLFDFEQFMFGVGQISLCAVNRHLALWSLLKCHNNQPGESQYYCMLTELCKDNPLSRTHQCQKQ